MKKAYKTPYIESIFADKNDIITTSSLYDGIEGVDDAYASGSKLGLSKNTNPMSIGTP